MATRKRKAARRVRKARNALIALLLLAAAVLGVWILVLDEGSPLDSYLAGRGDVNATGAPGVTPTALPGTPTEEPATPPVEGVTPEATDAPSATPDPTHTQPPVTDTPSPSPTATPTASPTPTATPEPTPEPTPVDLEYPYYIEIDRGMQVVRVYTIGEDGTYSLLAREMICSTDTFGYKPPQGTYKMNGEKLRWMMSLFGTYAQYATRISGHILFHAVPTTMCYANTLNADDYRARGTNASAGCVRLLCADAKWIYDNVPAGTMVRYVNNPRDEEKLKELAAPPLGSGNWDPTDNREDNPDYDPSYEASKPLVTPALGVTPAPTEPWTPDVYN